MQFAIYMSRYTNNLAAAISLTDRYRRMYNQLIISPIG